MGLTLKSKICGRYDTLIACHGSLTTSREGLLQQPYRPQKLGHFPLGRRRGRSQVGRSGRAIDTMPDSDKLSLASYYDTLSGWPSIKLTERPILLCLRVPITKRNTMSKVEATKPIHAKARAAFISRQALFIAFLMIPVGYKLP
jgi:hypothetical protein